MASQFAHMETYAISPSAKSPRGSVRGIFGELKRQPGFCDHVVVPKDPVVIFDVERGHKPCARPSLLIQQAEFRCVENAKLATVSCINGKSRKLRKDTAIVRVDVHSYPVPNAEVEPSDPTLNAWMQDVIHHVRAEVGTMGGRVEIAVGHFDEAYPHLHIVSTHPSGKAANIHPGCLARDAARVGGANKREADRSYRNAMIRWQDGIHEVNAQYGMMRTGPKRARMTRATYMAEKASVDRRASAEEAALEAETKAAIVTADATSRLELAMAREAALQRQLDDIEQQKLDLEASITAAADERESLRSDRVRNSNTAKEHLEFIHQDRILRENRRAKWSTDVDRAHRLVHDAKFITRLLGSVQEDLPYDLRCKLNQARAGLKDISKVASDFEGEDIVPVSGATGSDSAGSSAPKRFGM